VAADAAEDHIMTSTDVQYLQQYMHAAGFLLEFCDWLHTAKATTADGVTLLKRIMAGLVTWQRHIAQHNDHYGKAAVVQWIKTELLALMTAQRIRFDDATVEQSQLIVQEWRSNVAACSNRACQRLQQVRGLFCSYLHFLCLLALSTRKCLYSSILSCMRTVLSALYTKLCRVIVQSCLHGIPIVLYLRTSHN
jgi:hypothetical protein